MGPVTRDEGRAPSVGTGEPATLPSLAGPFPEPERTRPLRFRVEARIPLGMR
jgi:hypothetical protein